VPTTFSLDDYAALYAARDLGELIGLADSVDAGAGIWALLRPTDNKGQTLLGLDGHVGLDPLPAGQIARIHFPMGNEVVAATERWAAHLLGLLTYQNVWAAKTAAILSLWEAGSLIAVVGSSQSIEESTVMIHSVGLAMRRLHQVAESQRDIEGARHLMARTEKPVLLADRAGKILFGTAGAYGILKRSDNRKDVLPPALRSAIEQDLKRVRYDGYQVSISELPLPEPTTTQALVSLHFFRKVQSGGRLVDLKAALQTLTPAERKVYGLLVQGLRTKEIANQLGVSFHTAKHHCSHIVRKSGCSDRLALIAKAHPVLEPEKAQPVLEWPNSKKLEVPPLQGVNLLPAPTLRPKAAEPV
jgi:DNA-binding NarL/FixJ family response regulator